MKKSFSLYAFVFLLIQEISAQNVHYNLYLNYMGNVLPDFSALGAPDRSGTNDCFDLEGIPEENSDHYALVFEYNLKVKKNDTYTFRLCSDDGSRLYIDGTLLSDIDGTHGPIYQDVEIPMEKGIHNVKVEYFEYQKSQTLNLLYKTSAHPSFTMLGMKEGSHRPSFVRSQTKETARRMKAWVGTDEVIVFPILTDVHTCNRETYRHIGYIADRTSVFHYDFMANLGDIGLHVEPAHSNREYADDILRNTLEEMAKFKGVFLFAPGNHDFDGGNGRHLSSAELSEIFQKPSAVYAGENLHLCENNCWCYYDIPEKHFRVILLNSQNSEMQGEYHYTFGNDQLDWLIGVLQQTPDGTDVLLMCHSMPLSLGEWVETAEKKGPSNQTLCRILSDYARKNQGSESGLQWNFSRKKGRLVGLITGHSHVNAYTLHEGVNYFISQGYGKMENSRLKPGERRAWYNSRKTLCCDIIVVKPSTGEIHTFRLGAGGASMDYLIKY